MKRFPFKPKRRGLTVTHSGATKDFVLGRTVAVVTLQREGGLPAGTRIVVYMGER